MLKLNYKSGVPICDQIVNGFVRMKALGLVESGEQEGDVQLLGAVGAAVAAARAGHRIETVDHVAHLPHQSNLLFGQRLVVGEGLDIVFYLLQRGHPA